jgi:hypothetical protein
MLTQDDKQKQLDVARMIPFAAGLGIFLWVLIGLVFVAITDAEGSEKAGEPHTSAPSESSQQQKQQIEDHSRSLLLGLASRSDPAIGHDCFVPQQGKRNRGYSSPVFSRPASLELNAECWRFFRIDRSVQLLLAIGTDEALAVAQALLFGELDIKAPAAVQPACEPARICAAPAASN